MASIKHSFFTVRGWAYDWRLKTWAVWTLTRRIVDWCVIYWWLHATISWRFWFTKANGESECTMHKFDFLFLNFSLTLIEPGFFKRKKIFHSLPTFHKSFSGIDRCAEITLFLRGRPSGPFSVICWRFWLWKYLPCLTRMWCDAEIIESFEIWILDFFETMED